MYTIQCHVIVHIIFAYFATQIGQIIECQCIEGWASSWIGCDNNNVHVRPHHHHLLDNICCTDYTSGQSTAAGHIWTIICIKLVALCWICFGQ